MNIDFRRHVKRVAVTLHTLPFLHGAFYYNVGINLFDILNFRQATRHSQYEPATNRRRSAPTSVSEYVPHVRQRFKTVFMGVVLCRLL